MLKKITIILITTLLLFTGCAKEFNSNIKSGKNALKNKKIIDAIGYFENAIELKSENPKGYYWLAMAYKEKMRYGNFVINMNKTMIYGKEEYENKIAGAYYDFAKDLEKNNRIETMYDAFERLLEIDPDYQIEEDYAIHLGNKYFEDEYDYKKALEFYKNVENSELPEEMKQTIFYRIAYCYYQLGEYKKANKYYNTILEEYPNHPKLKTIYYNIGKINFQLAQKDFKNKKYEQAIIRGETVLKIGKPKLWLSETRRILGDSYLRIGNENKAIEMYNQIVENDPYRTHRDTLYAMKKIREIKEGKVE